MKEEFRPIAGWDKYEVSNYGDVVNIKTGRILRANPHDKGYLKVALTDDGRRGDYYIHRLVGEAFLSGFSEERHVKHRDEDRTNNDVRNLYILAHRTEVPTHQMAPAPYPTKGRVRILETGQEFPTIRMCARYIRGEYSSIYACLRGERQSHLGFTFEWIEE